MREILEKAAAESAGRDAIAQKIGDYYGSCMDEKAVECQRAEAAASRNSIASPPRRTRLR